MSPTKSVRSLRRNRISKYFKIPKFCTVKLSELPSLCMNDSTVAGCFSDQSAFCRRFQVFGCPLRSISIVEDDCLEELVFELGGGDP